MDYVSVVVNVVAGVDVRYSKTDETGARKWHKVTNNGVNTIFMLRPKKIVHTTDHGVETIHFKSRNGDSICAPVGHSLYTYYNFAIPEQLSDQIIIGGDADE